MRYLGSASRTYRDPNVDDTYSPPSLLPYLARNPKMEVATVVSCSFPSPRRMLAPSAAFRPKRTTTVSASATHLSFKSPTSLPGATDFSGPKLPPDSLDPASTKRNVIASALFSNYVISRKPPDVASHLFKERIIYLGLPLIPDVTELLLAEFLFLQFTSTEDPIFMYINSMGTTMGGQKIGNETEAFAIYDVMRYTEPPIHTLCVGNAWGEAALLLAAGKRGNRYALPSTTIMIRQPIARFEGQASAIENARNEIKEIKKTLVKLYAEHMGKTETEIEEDIRRPKYFSPSEAIEYGIIDKVIYTRRTPKGRRVGRYSL